MKKLLEENEKANFQLIGISSLLKDYRICFFLNSIFDIDFSIVPDHELLLKGYETPSSFRTFYAKNKLRDIQYFLFSNKAKTEVLIPEVAKMDYILKITTQQDLSVEIGQLLNTEGIIAATLLPLKKVKSYKLLEYILEEKTTTTLWQLNKTKRKL